MAGEEKTFILVGDILHLGRVAVKARSRAEAVKKALEGTSPSTTSGFRWIEDESTTEVED